MIDFVRNHANSAGRRLLLTASVAVLLLPIAACNKKESAPALAGPQTFASPQDAGTALEDAAKSQDMNQILVIFGLKQKNSSPRAMRRRTRLPCVPLPRHTGR